MRKGIVLLTLALALGMVPTAALAAQTQTAVIPVEITLEGPAQERGETFTVELEAKETGYPMPAGSQGKVCCMTLQGASSGSIRIPCEELGVFEYTIRQRPGTDPDCTYDARQYTLRVFVTADETGEKIVTAVLRDPGGEKTDQVRFHNRYAAPVSVSLSARKTLDGGTPKDGAFTFRLLSEDGTVLFEEKNDGRQVCFPAMKFDAAGTYRYFLKEVKGKDSGIIYDRAVYTVTVEVTKDVDYRAKVTYERNGKAWSGTPAFANYTDTGNAKTGDNIGIYVTGLILSAAGLGLLGGLLRKRRK